MRHRGWFLPALAVAALMLTGGCERVDLDAKDDSGTTATGRQVMPVGHGRGIPELPYTVGEILNGGKPQSLSGCWVMGYVVGSTYSSFDNALFEVPTAYSSNVLLSDDSLCTDASRCIAVELNTSATKKAFSLNAHPECFRQFVVLTGVYGQYFKRVGLRQISGGYWLPGFDTRTLYTDPIEWDEVEVRY